MRSFSLLSFAVLASTVACSSGSSPKGAPVIDALQVPSQFSVSGTTYSVTGTMTFHDDSAPITGLHEKIPSYQLDSTVALSAPTSQGTAQVELGFQAQQAIPSGTQVEIDVSLVDSTGGESPVQANTITVP